MTGSCIMFGCSVSSFVYRRQEKDPAQQYVFVVLVLYAVVVGWGLRTGAEVVQLVYVTWAMTLAMPICVAVFWLRVSLANRRVDSFVQREKVAGA